MKAELRYGNKNTKGKPTQSIYIRIKHSSLDWDKSLKIKINAEDWNFKKCEIITHKSLNNPIHSEHLKEVSQKVKELFYTLKYKAEAFEYSNRIELKEWVKEKNRKAFLELCETWYREYLETKQVIRQPYISELYKELINKIYEKGDMQKDRKVRVMNIYRNICAFEKYYGRKIRTDELSINLWANEMIPFFRDEYEHGEHSESEKEFSGAGLSTGTIKIIVKAIKQTAKEYRGAYNFHNDIFKDSFNIKVVTEAKTFLTPVQIESILNYDGHIPNLDNKLWFLNVMYYGCFRINEVYRTLEGKTPKQVWEKDIEIKKNQMGKDVYHLKCYNSKQRKVHSKLIPMFDKLGVLLFGGFENAKQGNFPLSFPKLSGKDTYRQALQQIAKKLKIEGRIIAHTTRRSFLNNLKKEKIKYADMMQYSGHKSESALLHYLDSSDNNVPTDVNLNK